MSATEWIDRYVTEVVVALPWRQREDVALELRSLLREDLQRLSEEAGRPADEDMALELLRDFGEPGEVAARYHSPWTIIRPEDTRGFLKAALIGGALLIAAAVPSTLLDPGRASDPKEALLLWLGVLVVFYGLKSAFQRRFPRHRPWRPGPSLESKPSRLGSAALALLIGVGIVAYGAPHWLYAQLTGGAQLAPWFAYDPTFQSARLPWLLVLWAGHGLLFAVAAVRGQWTRFQRWLSHAFTGGAVVLLVWFASAGRLFVEAVPNASAHAFLRAFILIIVLDLGLRIYRELTLPRLHAPPPVVLGA